MFIGIDVGSRASKVLVLEEDKILASSIRDTGANPGLAGKKALDEVLESQGRTPEEALRIVGTGYGRVSMPFAHETLTELSCHAAGVHFLNPEVRTVIDIGGQDSKVIRLDEHGNMVDFMMNDKCAAGTGRFLEVAAKALEVDFEGLCSLPYQAQTPCEINSMCAVFAESEIISLLATGSKREDIASGLNKSFARRVGAMAKRVGIQPPLAFVGGVAKNLALASEISAYLDLPITPLDMDPQLMGALGAAVVASRSGRQ